MSAKGKMTAARTALVLDHPFWGTLALYLKMQPDPGCQTAWVDGRTLGYEPSFIDSLSHDQVVGLLAHEVSHCAMGHPWRRDGRDLKGWNVACDLAINGDLRNSGFKLPADGLFPSGAMQGKSAEWIYAHLQQSGSQQPQPGAGQGQGQGQGQQPQQPGKAGQQPPSKQSQQPGQPSPQPQPAQPGQQPGQPGGAGDEPNPLGEVRDAPTGPDADGSPAPSAEDWKQRVSRAASQAKMRGNLPGGMQRNIGRALKPQLDVRALLLRFFTERAAADYSWTRPSARFIAQGLYMPALESRSLGEIAILCDTSGSIDAVALSRARGILESVIEECNPAGVTLHFVDTRIAHTERLERGDQITWTPKGGGGTNFISAFAEMERSEHNPACIIAITDLDARLPEQVPSIPVLWLCTEEDGRAPWGEVVYCGE